MLGKIEKFTDFNGITGVSVMTDTAGRCSKTGNKNSRKYDAVKTFNRFSVRLYYNVIVLCYNFISEQKFCATNDHLILMCII